HRSIDVGPLARETIPIGMNATRGLIEGVEGDVVARILSPVEKIALAVTPVYGRVEMRPRVGHIRPVAPNRAFTLVDPVLENVEAKVLIILEKIDLAVVPSHCGVDSVPVLWKSIP